MLILEYISTQPPPPRVVRCHNVSQGVQWLSTGPVIHAHACIGSTLYWQLHAEHEAAWNGIKETLYKHPVLQYYHESKALKVSTYAYIYGIGAIMLQETDSEWMPVAYASNSMTTAERNHDQIEKEQLGVVIPRIHCHR